MQLKKNDTDDKFVIRGYSQTGFRVAGKVHEGVVLVSATYAEPAPLHTFEDLAEDHVRAIASALGPVDVLLIGTGAGMKLLPREKRAWFEASQIPVDVMDTGAAARTYNVLVAEDRKAACLLFPSGA